MTSERSNINSNAVRQKSATPVGVEWYFGVVFTNMTPLWGVCTL